MLLTFTLMLGSCTGSQRTATPSPSPDSKQASTQSREKTKRECKAGTENVNPELTCANVAPDTGKERSVLLDNKPLPKEKVIIPDETLKTPPDSRAELQFNESSVVKADKKTTFKFKPTLRRSDLADGGVLAMILPGSLSIIKSGSSQEGFIVEATEAKSEAKGTAYVIRRDAKQKRTQVFGLTESPVRVSAKGKTVELKAGQSVTATEQGLGNIEEFNLCEFLATEELVAGLGPTKRDEEIVRKKTPSVQLTYYAVRGEIMLAYQKLCPRVITETTVQQVCPPPP